MTHTIFHVSGGYRRIYTTASEARLDPHSTVFLSCELEMAHVATMLAMSGIARNRVVFDWHGWDTVSQIVLSRKLLESMGATRITFVTERRHMRRVKWIARITYRFTPVALRFVVAEGDMKKDPVLRLLKDVFRAWWYRETGKLIDSAGGEERREQFNTFVTTHLPPVW